MSKVTSYLIKNLIAIWVLLFSQLALAQPADIVLVLIDKRTEDKLGVFPYERDVLATGVERLGKLGANEVLLKFFLDTHKSKDTDALLARALKKIPVTLQARTDNSERSPNELPMKHVLDEKFKSVRGKIQGESGWLPIMELSQNASAIGFIDSIYPALFVQTYKNQSVGTLYFHALESIYGTAFEVKGGELYIADKRVSLNRRGEHKYKWLTNQEVSYISFIDLLEGKIDQKRIKGKYIIFGYDGSKIHQVPTPAGPMNAHIAFYQSLMSVIAELERSPNTNSFQR